MNSKIEKTTSELREFWRDLTMDSVHKIKSALESLARDRDAQSYLQRETRDLPKGLEIYRDNGEGFVLLAYSEIQGTYRVPHNHGNAWVVYLVVSGEVEMGCYFNAIKADGSDHLVLRSREKLIAGDTRIYLPGEIHDTRCMSGAAQILRLTSLDLSEEQRAGRMQRFQLPEA